jgi:hypothetical protein
MRKLAVSAEAVPARSTAFFSAAFSVADSSSHPRTFDSKHEDSGEHSPWDKRAC